jgi:diguanylate cyclase
MAMVSELVEVLAASAAGDTTLETMTRPLLELLAEITGLESTYLTLIDWRGDRQSIVFALNRGALQLPEGLSVEWSDTLCRRSLEEGRPYVRDVAAVWGDSAAARDLGLHSYASVPVLDRDGGVVGTLCGASSQAVDLDQRHLHAMQLFSRLVSDQVAREAATQDRAARRAALVAQTRRVQEGAGRDGVTGLVDDAGIRSWLAAVLPGMRRGADQVALAVVDVDELDRVTERYGPGIGDVVLNRFAQSLAVVGGPGDLHGRLGRDEFVVASVLPDNPALLGAWAGRLRRAAYAPLGQTVVRGSVGVVGLDDGSLRPEAALELALAQLRRHRTSEHASQQPAQ